MASEYDGSPIHLEPLADERHRPVSVRRKKVGAELRVDATRISGPIRGILEPLLWISFAFGFLWLLMALDPALRGAGDEAGVVYRYALPLAVCVSLLLLVSTVSALIWLPTSTSAVRSRTGFSGIGMMASAWLFTQLNPVESHDFEKTSLFCLAVGALQVAVCCVPWTTRPAPRIAKVSTVRGLSALVLALLFVVIAFQVWSAAGEGLVGVAPADHDGWELLLPYLGAMVLLLAALRHILVRPAREADERAELDPIPA